MADRSKVIVNVFKETDMYDYEEGAKEEEAMMKNLMKRYERVELQYNVDNARKDLIFNYEEISKQKIIPKHIITNDPLN
jgi:hypothetical protein